MKGEWLELLDALPDPVVVTDESGTILFVNPQVEALVGYERGELVGRPVEILVPENVREGHVRLRSEYVGQPRMRPMCSLAPLSIRAKSGDVIPVQIGLGPLRWGGRLLIMSVIHAVPPPEHGGKVREAAEAREENGRPAGSPLSLLTPRQREVLQLTARGHSVKAIGRLLGISAKTVEAHRAQLMDRLDIHDVAGLVRFAIRVGLVAP